MKPGHIAVSALVAVLGLAILFAAQYWRDLSGISEVDDRISHGEEFTRSRTQAIGTEVPKFDPNARVGVIRGMTREEYRIPKLAGPSERATLSAVVDDGMRAMSVRINDVLGVAGFVLPGDRVDIMMTRDDYTDILLQNVKILAIGQLADERADKPSLAKTATVEVNSIDAQKLTLAQTAGTLSLALRAAGSVEAAAPRRITLDETEGETAVDLLFDPNARGDFPNDPVRCAFPYGPCEKWLKPAHKWFDPGPSRL